MLLGALWVHLSQQLEYCLVLLHDTLLTHRVLTSLAAQHGGIHLLRQVRLTSVPLPLQMMVQLALLALVPTCQEVVSLMLVLSSLLQLINVPLHFLDLHLDLLDALFSLLLHLVQVLFLLLHYMDLEQVVVLEIVDMGKQRIFVKVDSKVLVLIVVFKTQLKDLDLLLLGLLFSH